VNAREHAEQNPGHLIVSTVGQPTFCGHGDYRDPLLDLTAVKYAGTETQTDEEWARRQRTSEAWAPRLERARRTTITTLDALIQGDHP
jgi:hypothetical protein